jgi:hypothetical protein
MLGQAIASALDSNESALAAQVGATAVAPLDEATRRDFSDFAGWCKGLGVRALPARPHTVAAFIRSAGLASDRTMAILASIEAVHDHASAANPVATAAVKSELHRILPIAAAADPPRSWTREEKCLFGLIPAGMKQIIWKHQRAQELWFPRAQNKVAELRRQLATAPETKPVASTDKELNT